MKSEEDVFNAVTEPYTHRGDKNALGPTLLSPFPITTYRDPG